MEPGICYIKPEYLIEDVLKATTGNDHNKEENNKRKNIDEEDAAANATNANENNADKYQKIGKKNRRRGQNKHRPIYKEDRTLHLCNSLINGPSEEKCPSAKCRYVHDLQQYLAKKGEDLGDKCYVYELKGYCPRGVTCRYGKTHIDAEGRNIKGPNFDEKAAPTTFNGITAQLQVRLRKHEYDFSKCKKLIKKFEKLREERKLQMKGNTELEDIDEEDKITDEKETLLENKSEAENDIKETFDKVETENDIKETFDKVEAENDIKETFDKVEAENDIKETFDKVEAENDIKETFDELSLDMPEKPFGSCTDDDEIKGRDCKESKRVDFAEKIILSPLTTVGNLPFRRICKGYGADITCGEMACCVPLVKGLIQEWALTKRHESEDIFGVQLCGNNPNIIAQTAQLMQETAKVDFIDLNIGCPIDLIYQNGGGSALMRRTNILELSVRTCSALNSQIPFTVKMRTGIYADKSVAHVLLPLVEEWGAGAVTLHGRSREQRYTKNANWEYIEEAASKVKKIPVIGNGDILNFEDYNEKRKIAPHVSSVMIGRGALIKPWIFKEIKEQKHWDPTSTERFEMMRSYVNYGLEHWGADTKGIENTRRFLLEWQSFLYRYIPYDLLLTPPQQIQQRPQSFRGRDEMETLMSSPNSQDWVKLSEMLLGRVPEGFSFVPKHKANSY